MNSRCVEPSIQALCHLLFPECQSTTPFGSNAFPILFCYSCCTALSNGSCGSEFRQMMQTVTTYFQSFAINPVHFYSGQPICSKLPDKNNFAENCADINIYVLPPDSHGLASSSLGVTAVVVPIGCIILITLCIVAGLIWKKRKTEKTTSVCTRSAMYIDMTGEGSFKTEIEWDDDIAYAILETLVNGKRLKLAEQIGEGQSQNS